MFRILMKPINARGKNHCLPSTKASTVKSKARKRNHRNETTHNERNGRSNQKNKKPKHRETNETRMPFKITGVCSLLAISVCFGGFFCLFLFVVSPVLLC